MTDVPDDLLSYMFTKAKTLMLAIKKATRADFVMLSIEGVDVPHFHIHLIPRKHNDALPSLWNRKEYSEGESKKIAEQITQCL